MENVIQVKNKKFVIVSTKAEHEDHATYIATWSGRTYLVRVFKTGFVEAMADYKVLKHAGINMAKVCFHDEASGVIVFDYFPEDDCLEDLSKGPLDDRHFEAFFSLYRFARFSKVALAWEPQNFMLRGSQMFYLPTKWAKLDDSNKFEEKGIRYWFHGKEGIANLKRKGFDVSALKELNEGEVNKAAVLIAVKYW